jgi:hypothetical protein
MRIARAAHGQPRVLASAWDARASIRPVAARLPALPSRRRRAELVLRKNIRSQADRTLKRACQRAIQGQQQRGSARGDYRRLGRRPIARFHGSCRAGIRAPGAHPHRVATGWFFWRSIARNPAMGPQGFARSAVSDRSSTADLCEGIQRLAIGGMLPIRVRSSATPRSKACCRLPADCRQDRVSSRVAAVSGQDAGGHILQNLHAMSTLN